MLCWDSRTRTCFIPLSWLCGTTTTTYHERKFIFVIIIIIVIRCRRCHRCCHHQSIVGNEKIICPHPTQVSSRTDLSHSRRSNMAEITLRETEKFVQVWVLFPSQLLPANIYVHEIDFVSHNAPSHHIISHEQTHTDTIQTMFVLSASASCENYCGKIMVFKKKNTNPCFRWMGNLHVTRYILYRVQLRWVRVWFACVDPNYFIWKGNKTNQLWWNSIFCNYILFTLKSQQIMVSSRTNRRFLSIVDESVDDPRGTY